MKRAEPMRIMLVSQFYPPIIGGVEVHVRTLARGLARRGHEVLVATHVAPGEAPAERADGPVRVRTLQGSIQRLDFLFSGERRHAAPVADPGLQRGLRELAEEFRPHVVHAHNWLGRSYVPVKHALGVPYVVSLHDSGRICTQGRMMFRNQTPCDHDGFARCLSCCSAQFGSLKGTVTYLGNRAARPAEARAVDLFLPVSTAVAGSNHLPQDGLPYEVVPNFGTDALGTGHADDPRLAQLPDRPFLLQVGDVVPDKGVDVLFSAYRMLHSPPPLVLIGRIAENVARSLPPGVIAVGPWPHELVLEAWQRSLLGTIPSLCLDACPTVTFEAMAAGKPVVASRIGGLTDQVVDGVTGLLVDPGDSNDLAVALDRLIGDSGLRTRLGSAARDRFDAQYRADVVIDRIEGIYRRLAGDRADNKLSAEEEAS
jgi:glycosyltransferase involved in cell wall biosynthesis